jgi:hypothetical protein
MNIERTEFSDAELLGYLEAELDTDLLDVERKSALSAALKLDPALRARLARLQQDLARLRDWPEPEQPVPEFVRKRWISALQLERLSRQPQTLKPWRWALGGAAAAFTLVLLLRPPQTQPEAYVVQTPVSAFSAEQLANTRLLRRVQQHFISTERALKADAAPALSAELIAQHRQIAKLADQQGKPELARLLRALEPLFLSLDKTADSAQDDDEARAQLMFELTVLQTKWRAQTSKPLLTPTI